MLRDTGRWARGSADRRIGVARARARPAPGSETAPPPSTSERSLCLWRVEYTDQVGRLLGILDPRYTTELEQPETRSLEAHG